jgi:hypothetical protein
MLANTQYLHSFIPLNLISILPSFFYFFPILFLASLMAANIRAFSASTPSKAHINVCGRVPQLIFDASSAAVRGQGALQLSASSNILLLMMNEWMMMRLVPLPNPLLMLFPDLLFGCGDEATGGWSVGRFGATDCVFE